jgi:hypothetical protein
MKAKHVNENNNFEKTKDPLKSLGLGCKDYKDYVRIICNKYRLDPKKFFEELEEYMAENFDCSYEAIEEILALLELTPIEYQINYIDVYLPRYIDANRNELDDTKF